MGARPPRHCRSNSPRPSGLDWQSHQRWVPTVGGGSRPIARACAGREEQGAALEGGAVVTVRRILAAGVGSVFPRRRLGKLLTAQVQSAAVSDDDGEGGDGSGGLQDHRAR